MLGIIVVPYIGKDGKPYARVQITGTTADSITQVDHNAAEIAISHEAGRFHVVDYRGADAVDG